MASLPGGTIQEKLKQALADLAAGTAAHSATKDDLGRQLKKAVDAKVYCEGKLAEYLTESEQRKIDDDRANTNRKKKDAKEISRPQTILEDMRRAEQMLREEKRKTDSHNAQLETNAECLTTSVQVALKAYQDSVKPSTSGQKRGADQIETPGPPNNEIIRHKKPKKDKVGCTQCITHGWDCDGSSQCENCVLRNKRSKCKRIMSRYYKANTYSNHSCTFAHEGDGYTILVQFTRLLKNDDTGPSPVETKAKEDKKARDAAMKDTKEDTSLTDGLFDRLGRKDDGSDDGGAAPAPV